jgi:glucose/mannose-6-phosphate isomerase
MGEEQFPEDYTKYDKEDMKKELDDFPNQIRDAYRTTVTVGFKEPIRNIIIMGMGGSGIAGQLMRLYLQDLGLHIVTNESYKVSRAGDKNSLVFINSYSGNTEEAVSSYRDAVRRKCNIISISSGGRLEELARMNRTKHIRLPKNLQPRVAIAYSFFTMLKVLESLNMMASKEKEVKKLVEILSKQKMDRFAISFSEKLVGKTPIIYSSGRFYPVAYRWKTQFNENAKIHAFAHKFSELNHNELVGYQKLLTKYHVIILKADDDHRRIQKRMVLTRDLVQQHGVDSTEVGIKGPLLNKIFTAVHMGDLIAYYLALRYKTDPSPVSIIEDFKKKMGPFV